MSFKKTIFIISFLAVFGFLFNFNLPEAKAITAAELRAQIEALQAQLIKLRQQLTEMGEVAEEEWCHDFEVNLRYGDTGNEVNLLQLALDKEGLYISPTDRGGYFGEYMASAVVAFQEKYASDILTPWGLKHGTGFVGKTTRAKLNAIYGCGVEEAYIKVTSPNGGEKWEVGKTYDITWKSKGVDKVDIGYRREGSGADFHTIATEVSASLGKYSWTTKGVFPAEYQQDSFYVIIAETPYIAGAIQIEDESDNYFTITKETCHTTPLWDWSYCSPTCKCNAGEGDCDSNADCNTGYCAMNVGENYGQVSSMDVCEEKEAEVGSLSLTLDAATPIAQNIVKGSNDVTFLKAKLSANYVEDIKVNSITVSVYRSEDSGTSTAQYSDLSNLELYDGDTQIGSTQVGITVGFNDDSYVSFYNLNWIIPKGSSKVFTVIADIPVGTTAPALYMGIILTGGVQSEGVNSGQSIRADGSAIGEVMTIVSSGSLSVSLAPDTPAATTINVASTGITPDVPFLKFKLTASYEEPIIIQSIKIKRIGCSDGNFGEIKLYDGGNQISNEAYFINGIATFGFSSGSYLVIPAASSKSITVKADLFGWGASTLLAANCKLCVASNGTNYEIVARGANDYINASGATHLCGNEMNLVSEEKSITVTSPNGGEKWVKGSTYDITWNSAGIDKVDIILDNRSEGIQPDTVIVYNINNNGQYSWTIPQEIADEEDAYKITVRTACLTQTLACYNYAPGEGIEDHSDDWFSIVSAKTSPCDNYGDVNQDGYLTDDDKTAIERCILGYTCTDEQKLRADVNNDGEVDTSDVTALERYLAGTDSTLAACSKTPPCNGYGDPNGNGFVNRRDIDLIERYILGMVSFTDEQKSRSDVNNSGEVNMGDVTALERYILDIDSTLPVCELGVKFLGKQLASLSEAVSQLMEKIKELINR